MLDTLCKILEQIICVRLESHLEYQSLSANPYGFRKRKSTVDAIEKVTNIGNKTIEGNRWMYGTKEYRAVVTFDVENAFNSTYGLI